LRTSVYQKSTETINAVLFDDSRSKRHRLESF
jgi:hypothetical protein